LIFLHIPKTAGTAVASVLTQWFGVDEIMPWSMANVRPASHPATAIASRRHKLFGIGMHLDSDQVLSIRHALRHEQPPFVFTVLRNPRERLISQYMHWRRTDDASLVGVSGQTRAAYLAARELPIGEFLATRNPFIIEHFRNYQARLLAGFATAMAMPNDQILATARANLASFDVVGRTSQLDDVLALVAEAYGWCPPGTVQQVNVSPRREAVQFDDASENLIAEYNSIDDVLWHDFVSLPPPPTTRSGTCFHDAEPGVLTALLGSGETRFDMRQPLDGSGWHGREGESSEVRWTGPGRRSVIRLSAPRGRRLTLSLQIVCALDWSIVDGLLLTLDGLPPVAAPRRGEQSGYPAIETDFVLHDASQDRRELSIEVPFTRSHSEVNPSWIDARQKGIAVGEISLSISNAVPPASLADLFGPGVPCPAEPPSQLPAILDVRPGDSAIPSALRDLSLDLPVLNAILEYINPQLVIPDYIAGPLGRLTRGNPNRDHLARMAFVATLFGMANRGGKAATFANCHEESLLLLAMADDARVRVLSANPSLVPHVHMLGCKTEILIANLGGMRRDGGPKFMEGFLWLLERAGATTPEELVNPADDMDFIHIDLQLRLLLNAAMEAAGDGSDADLGPAILATLTPEDANPRPLNELRANLDAVRKRGDTLLDLVDPGLLQSLDTAMNAIQALPPRGASDSASPLLEAHRIAFRLVGVLFGWRQAGLARTKTASLAREIASANAVNALLSEKQRWLAEKALRLDIRDGVGIVLPRPWKLSEERGDLAHFRDLPSMQPVGVREESTATSETPAYSDAIRAQIAHEVRDVIRTLSSRLPGEEIIWLDAGRSTGALQASVELPENVRERCRFLRIDLSAEDAFAPGVFGSTRCHLITAFDVLEECADPFAVLQHFRRLNPAYLMVSPAMSEPQGLVADSTCRWTWDAAGFSRMAEQADLYPVNVAPRSAEQLARGLDSSLPLYLTPRNAQSHSISWSSQRSKQPGKSSPQRPAPKPDAAPSNIQSEPAPPPSASPGVPSMIAAMPSPCLTDADFFARHYSRLSGWLNAFAHARHRATTSGDQAAALAELVALSNRIAAEGLTIVSGTPTSGESAGVREFFGIAARLRDALRQSPIAAHVAAGDELEKHLDYFHHNIPDAALETAIQSAPASIYVRECVANCIHVLTDRVFNGYQWSCPDPRKVTDFFDTTAAEAAITPAARGLMTAVTALEGWCSPQKSLLLYSLARAHKPQTVVEIGIYGGRSIVPIAAALKDNGVGQVYGIETWSGSAAVSYRTNIANDFWWQNIDFSKLKGDFLQFVVQHQLQDTIRVVEAASDRCGGLFDRIDMLHIDGGHSTYGAAQDVVNYVSKVPSGGIIVYDDINWPSTAAGLDILRDSCRLLHVVPAFGSETEPGCAAFVKV
jgi:predicted O-methyltransferase YrrM